MSSTIHNDLYSNSAIKQPSRPFYHRLIMRDYHQIKPPLSQWAINLRELIHAQGLSTGVQAEDMEVVLSDWFWQATDILIFAGLFREAREVCYAHIQLMLNMRQTRDNDNCLWHAFKSWVTLARVDRLSKQYTAASKKLQAHQDWRSRVLRCPLGSSNLANVAIERVRRCYQVEKIKLYFSMHQVHRIITEFSATHHGIHYDHAFTIDALILAYIQSGCIHDALSLAEKMQSVLTISDFAFMRAQEIKWSFFYEKIDMHTLLHLHNTMLQSFELESVRLSDLILSLHLARLLSHAKRTDYAESLLTLSLVEAIKLNDEVLKAEILAMLFTNGIRYYDGEVLEDYLVAHYHITQYPAARAILAKSLPALKHVEINQDFHQLSLLAQDFLLLASVYI